MIVIVFLQPLPSQEYLLQHLILALLNICELFSHFKFNELPQVDNCVEWCKHFVRHSACEKFLIAAIILCFFVFNDMGDVPN